jgi:hypothetical protein
LGRGIVTVINICITVKFRLSDVVLYSGKKIISKNLVHILYVVGWRLLGGYHGPRDRYQSGWKSGARTNKGGVLEGDGGKLCRIERSSKML